MSERPSTSGRSNASSRVGAAFDRVRRADFLTPEYRARAADDRPLFIGYDATNSQPTTVRTMLELLDARPGDRVLDVGSGSGWTTALLASMVTRIGRVYGVELVPELVTWSRQNLARYAFDWASIDQAEGGTLGLPAQAPYDRILVSAQARRLPAPLVDQLAAGGRMVIPVDGRLSVVHRTPDGAVDEQRVGHYSFVPLR